MVHLLVLFLDDDKFVFCFSVMNEFGIKDTIAYKITRQILDHIYGSEEEMTVDHFVVIFKAYLSRGGTWEGILSGHIRCVQLLEQILGEFVDLKVK